LYWGYLLTAVGARIASSGSSYIHKDAQCELKSSQNLAVFAEEELFNVFEKY
jgi:hypothetical protein